MTKQCPRCEANPIISPHHSSPRQCAFPDGQQFSSDNYCCGTVEVLRDAIVDEGPGIMMNGGIFSTFSNDQNFAFIPQYIPDPSPNDPDVFPPAPEAFMAMTWYKSRGSTEMIVVYDGQETRSATLDDCEKAIAKLVELHLLFTPQ